MQKKEKFRMRLKNTAQNALPLAIFTLLVIMSTIHPAFADYKDEVSKLALKIVNIIAYVFQMVGFILAVYAIGQLVSALRENNPDAQQRCVTSAIVAIVLIFLPTIIDSLDIGSTINGTKEISQAVMRYM